jgi:hypothetical protein
MNAKSMSKYRILYFGLIAILGIVYGACEGCEQQSKFPTLSLPFRDNFDRSELGETWYTERPGRWILDYDQKNKQGRLCVEQAENNPLFLRARLPRDVQIEFDAWAIERDGDVKVEIFTDGKYNKSGYVLVHGGWNNTLSIIDRLDEHNRNRRWRRGGPIQNRRYHWRVVRTKDTINWYVDGNLYLTYKDPMPLEGPGHEFFAFGNWTARVCFDNLLITAPDTAKPAKQPAARIPTTQQPAAPPLRQSPEPSSTIQPPTTPPHGESALPTPTAIEPHPAQPAENYLSQPPTDNLPKLHNPVMIPIKPQRRIEVIRPHIQHPNNMQYRFKPVLRKTEKSK